MGGRLGAAGQPSNLQNNGCGGAGGVTGRRRLTQLSNRGIVKKGHRGGHKELPFDTEVLPYRDRG